MLAIVSAMCFSLGFGVTLSGVDHYVPPGTKGGGNANEELSPVLEKRKVIGIHLHGHDFCLVPLLCFCVPFQFQSWHNHA